MRIPPSKKAPLYSSSSNFWVEESEYLPQLQMMGRVTEVIHSGHFPPATMTVVVDGARFGIPLGDLLDLDAERARLRREIEKAEGEIAKVDKKLGNPKFTERAPEAVVAEQTSRREGYAAELAKLEGALAALG